MNQSAIAKAFHLKGRMFTFTVIQFDYDNLTQLDSQLDEAIAQAPGLFEKTGMVLDFSRMSQKTINLSQLCELLYSKAMYPVAVQSPHPEHAAMAISQGLPVINASSQYDREFELQADKPKTPVNESTASRFHNKPVRSGQQLASVDGDLIITAAVSHGAELLAQGHIHIYGPLRGRALAGINGDKNARIFCQSLEAELVSIAGFYRLRDELPERNGPCQIYLQDEQLQIEFL